VSRGERYQLVTTRKQLAAGRTDHAVRPLQIVDHSHQIFSTRRKIEHVEATLLSHRETDGVDCVLAKPELT
jgi:hypothetical protein